MVITFFVKYFTCSSAAPALLKSFLSLPSVSTVDQERHIKEGDYTDNKGIEDQTQKLQSQEGASF